VTWPWAFDVSRHAGRVTSGAAFAVVLAFSLAGCSAASERDEARAAATRFVAALASPDSACALMAPGTRTELMDQAGSSCAAALAQQHVPTAAAAVLSVSVAGHSAQVVLSTQAIFLARFDDGWKVTAAGCSRPSADPSVPYACMVKGG
jgi:hypothetical protein